jgi:hypothetical protein
MRLCFKRSEFVLSFPVSTNVAISTPQIINQDWNIYIVFYVQYHMGLLKLFLRSKALVSYGCETWSLTLREEHRQRVFENRVLRRSFGTKRDEVTGGWRKLHNEELHNLYSSPSTHN